MRLNNKKKNKDDQLICQVAKRKKWRNKEKQKIVTKNKLRWKRR